VLLEGSKSKIRSRNQAKLAADAKRKADAEAAKTTHSRLKLDQREAKPGYQMQSSDMYQAAKQAEG
jgi:hypothetical protein